MAGNRQFSVLSDNEIVKCQGHVCLIMKIGNQVGSFGKCFHFPRGMFNEVDVRFAGSFHALCSRHADPPELPHLADRSPMHGRNVALVAAMNTPTTFCNINYVQKKWVLNIMTDKIINKWNEICCNLSYRRGVSFGGNGKTKMASRSWVNCLSLWHFGNNSVSLGHPNLGWRFSSQTWALARHLTSTIASVRWLCHRPRLRVETSTKNGCPVLIPQTNTAD